MKKKFFSYVIPSILGFALSGVYAIVDGFLSATASVTQDWRRSASPIRSRLFYRRWARESEWEERFTFPSALGEETTRLRSDFSVGRFC